MTKSERLLVIKAVAKRRRLRRSQSGRMTNSGARAKVIEQVEAMKLPPLKPRHDTRPLNFEAFYIAECPECRQEYRHHEASDKIFRICEPCRARIRRFDKGATKAEIEANWVAIMAVITDEWQSIKEIAEKLGVNGGSGFTRVRDRLARMADRGKIEGTHMRVSSKVRALRVYRRLQDAQ